MSNGSALGDLKDDNVLVACPNYLGKSYALEAYLKAYNSFSYPFRGLFMVDNTGKSLKFYEHLKSLKVPCAHVNPTRNWHETFSRCWKKITEHAVENKYRWVASIEADNVCPALTLDILLNIAGYTRAVHVAHGYDWHSITWETQSPSSQKLIGLGCNLILTELLAEIYAQKKWATDAFEAEVYEYPKRHGKVTVELYNLIDIRHFDAKPGEEFYQFYDEPVPEFTPGTSVDRLKPKGVQ